MDIFYHQLMITEFTVQQCTWIKDTNLRGKDWLGLLQKNVWNGTAAWTRSNTSGFEMWRQFLKWDAAADFE